MELDVTKNINLIEQLKCRLLEDVSLLYDNMLKRPSDNRERTEILADIILAAALLAGRLGQEPEVLEDIILKKIRLGLLEENNPLYHTHTAILRHITGK